MSSRPPLRWAPVVAVALLVTAGCGSDDEEGPPPTLGGATVVERELPATPPP